MRLQSHIGLLVGLFATIGCAQDKSPTPKNQGRANTVSGASGKGTLGDAAEQKQAEVPLFVASSDDIDLSCKFDGKLNFLKSQGLSPVNNYLLARFSMIGASSLPFDKNTLPKWLERFGLGKTVFLENVGSGVRGFVATSERFNLVVFQGTHSLQGAVTDLRAVMASASPENIPGGMHKGFRDAYATVSAQLSEALKESIGKKVPTYFVGHSLGGALAVIASSEQGKAGVAVEGVVTLGQPRVGNDQFISGFEQAMQSKYARFVYENDPVPHLPPSTSSGSQVSSMIAGTGGLSQIINSGMGLIFSQAKFKHALAPQMLGNGRFASSAFKDDDSWDKEYWSGNSGAVGQIIQNPTAALNDSLIADHDVNRYLCAILEKSNGK